MTPCTRVCLHSYVRWDHHCVCLYLEGFRLGLYVERELKLHPRLLQLRQRESCRWVLRRMTIPTRSPSAPYALYGTLGGFCSCGGVVVISITRLLYALSARRHPESAESRACMSRFSRKLIYFKILGVPPPLLKCGNTL